MSLLKQEDEVLLEYKKLRSTKRVTQSKKKCQIISPFSEKKLKKYEVSV